ncbi:protein of unknown function, partial (plasmid) [Azospirillum baldaniorum]
MGPQVQLYHSFHLLFPNNF